MHTTVKILVSFGVLLLVLIICLLVLTYLYWRIFQPPKGNPYDFIVSPAFHESKKRLVCVGDSITHGNVSVSYVKMLAERLGDNFNVINAGINAELTYNVLQRLESIIACNPDFITILIGTNDINREMDLPSKKRGVRRLKLPQEPTQEWFTSNLREIIATLQKRTTAKIAVCSIPPLGEDPTKHAFLQSSKYSNIIADIAEKTQIPYLPVHEGMLTYLKANPSQPKYPYERRLIELTFLQFYFFGLSLDSISRRNGFSLLVDHVHLNTTGAKIIANLIEDFVTNEA